MTSGEKVALSLLAEICKLKADQAANESEKWSNGRSPSENRETDHSYQEGFFKGVEIATRAFEKRLNELTKGD